MSVTSASTTTLALQTSVTDVGNKDSDIVQVTEFGNVQIYNVMTWIDFGNSDVPSFGDAQYRCANCSS